MFKIKLAYRREPWAETGRTIYVEAPTPTAARSLAADVIDLRDWSIFAVEPAPRG